MQITSRDGLTQTTLDDNWVTISGIDWFPDGSKLVITAATENIREQKVFIADSLTGDITHININHNKSSTFHLPKWSPDGRMIGVQATTREDEIVNDLLIFDPEGGMVKANLTINRQQHLQQEWYWSGDSEAILLNFPPGKSIGVFYWRDNRVEELPLPKIEAGNVYITNLFGSYPFLCRSKNPPKNYFRRAETNVLTSASVVGRRMINLVPISSTLSARTYPPCASMISLVMAKPNPVPRPRWRLLSTW